MPSEGPLLIVSNHPSSFFEACLMSVLLPRDLYFLTRGDFFKKPIARWFLGQTHQVPIFRSEDGFDKLRSNQDTFAYCYATLKEGKVIVIFPETRTETEKRLRPIQKGAGRIALGAARIPEIDKPFRIMPIGATFSNPVKYRSLVSVRCGPVIKFDIHQGKDDRDIVTELTEQIEQALKPLLVQIDNPEREALYDDLQMLVFNSAGQSNFPVVSYNTAFPETEIRLSTLVNEMPESEFQDLSKKVASYHSLLRAYGLTDRYLSNHSIWSGGRLFTPFLAFVLIPGKIISSVPALLIQNLVLSKIKRTPFIGPTKWALGMIGYFLWYLILLIIGIAIGGWAGGVIAMALIMSGVLNMQHFHDLGFRGVLAPLIMSNKTIQQIRGMRTEIINRIK